MWRSHAYLMHSDCSINIKTIDTYLCPGSQPSIQREDGSRLVLFDPIKRITTFTSSKQRLPVAHSGIIQPGPHSNYIRLEQTGIFVRCAKRAGTLTLSLVRAFSRHGIHRTHIPMVVHPTLVCKRCQYIHLHNVTRTPFWALLLMGSNKTNQLFPREDGGTS